MKQVQATRRLLEGLRSAQLGSLRPGFSEQVATTVRELRTRCVR